MQKKHTFLCWISKPNFKPEVSWFRSLMIYKLLHTYIPQCLLVRDLVQLLPTRYPHAYSMVFYGSADKKRARSPGWMHCWPRASTQAWLTRRNQRFVACGAGENLIEVREVRGGTWRSLSIDTMGNMHKTSKENNIEWN